MAGIELGRLERVDLRKIWVSEPADFTPWLALPENMLLLGEAIGIDLECEAQEKPVGPFSADIVCKDTVTDDWVVIENQLARTDHTHLGQLLTYAAGLQAVTIVWVAERFTDEHRAALDWLNEHTDERINAFGLEIEVWRIGTSLAAPKFNVVSKPNDWYRTAKQGASDSAPISELKQQQREFWNDFLRSMDDRGSKLKFSTPSGASITSPLGRTGVFLHAVLSTWGSESGGQSPEVRVELIFNHAQNSKTEYAAFEKQRLEIEAALTFPLTWSNPEGRITAKAFCRRDGDFRDPTSRAAFFDWLRSRLEPMERVLRPIVRSLASSATNSSSE